MSYLFIELALIEHCLIMTKSQNKWAELEQIGETWSLKVTFFLDNPFEWNKQPFLTLSFPLHAISLSLSLTHVMYSVLHSSSKWESLYTPRSTAFHRIHEVTIGTKARIFSFLPPAH